VLWLASLQFQIGISLSGESKMMSRFFGTNNSLNAFAGTHMLNGASGTGNGPLTGIAGLNHMPIGAVANSSGAQTGLGFAGMMTGLDAGTIMSNFAQHPVLNGTGGTLETANFPGFGFGGMMGAILQDAPVGNTTTPVIGHVDVQTMLDIMDDMPGIGLVGVGYMNVLDSFAA